MEHARQVADEHFPDLPRRDGGAAGTTA
jgi:hypothetical protein